MTRTKCLSGIILINLLVTLVGACVPQSSLSPIQSSTSLIKERTNLPFLINQEDTPLDIKLTASSSGNDSLTWFIVDYPSHGSLSGTAPDLTYTPNPNFSGSDNFTFKVNDGKFDSNIATVSITINPVNDMPVANDDSGATQEDTAIVINVLENDTDVDSDSLIVNEVIQGSNGSVVINYDDTITYTPDASFVGSDIFTYSINDGKGGADTASVTITVNPSDEDWDINGDGAANVLDMVLVGQHWGETGLAGWIREDVNEDGTVNVLDMIIIGQSWTG